MSNLTIYTKNTESLTIKDCVDSKTLSSVLKEHSKQVIKLINLELEKLIVLFGWKVAPSWKSLFIEMILDKYKYESLEDVLICLRDGRLGRYKKPFGVLDPATFCDWMAEHLEKKYKAKETELLKKKPEYEDKPKFKTRDEYNNFVKIGLSNQDELLDVARKKKEKEENYRKIKSEYFRNRTKK